MPVFTAAAAAIGTFFAGITLASIQAFAIRTLITIGISKLVANRANKSSAGANDVGSRVQLGPATNNKLPVTYGSAFLAPVVTDAKITTDQKTMYYVFSLCEASTGTMSFGKIFWNGKEVTLGAGDYSANNKVVSLTTNSTPPQVDTTINGHAWIYQFNDGSSSGLNTGGTSAITILSDASIPVADRWTSTDVMSDTCFIIVKVIYNKDVQDAQQMPRLSVELTNTLTKPGEVLLDYMTDVQYGCAIDVANIDTASLTALDAYSDELITYVPVGGGSATQVRYRIDGPVNTGDNCLSNLQQLVDACDSWLQYSELTGQWTIVMNKPYTGTLSSLYSVDSSVLIGGIDINPIDLNQTYNSLEVQYPNSNINDQTDYKVIDLTTVGTAWYNPGLLSPNEPDNRLTIQYPQINNYVRAVYLGVRRLLQSREDLTIVCNLDYSGIQVVAGDVVRVTLAEYGWTDKLFRVSQVQETKTGDGFLGSRITAFEYNSTVYADNALQDFIPEANTGLKDPNIFDQPTNPIIVTGSATPGSTSYFTVSSNVPASGSTLYMDFNYGFSSNVETHISYNTASRGDGTIYPANTTVSINVADLSAGNYYWSTTARNMFAGRQSNSSNVYQWDGPSLTPYSNVQFICTSSSGNLITVSPNTANVGVGQLVTVIGGTGAVAANTVVSNITGITTFTIDPAPTVPFVCADLNLTGGGITSNQIANGAIIAGKIANNAVTLGTITANAVVAGTIAANAVTANTIVAGSIDASKVQAFTLTSGQIQAGGIVASSIAANTITFENLVIGAVTQSKSTLSDPIVKPIPFTNVSNTWPNNTRCVVPAGGVTIIPSTDPQSSANTEYTEGSRIQVGYSVKMYVDPGNVANVSENWDQYNLVEVWKSGASSVFDRGFNTVRQAYDLTGNATSATNQQLHALGYAPGGTDLYSSDGGNVWLTYNGNSTSKTITGSMSYTSSTFTTYPRYVQSGVVGPFQTPDSGTINSGVGSRQGSNPAPIVWDQDAGANSVRYQTTSGGTITTGYQNDFLSMEFTPDTAGNGYPYTTSTGGYIFTGTNGDIFYSPTPFAPNENTTNAMRRENVPGLLKDLNSSYSGPVNANTYTAVVVGQTGTVLRSERTLGASDFANSWTAKSIYIQGNTSQPLLSDLYSVASDNTTNSPATSKWVTVGQYGMIQYSSDDGDAWDQVYLGNSVACDFNSIRYGNGKWVTVGDGGNIYVSSNAANVGSWAQLDTGNLLYTNGVSYGSIYGVYGNGNVNTNTRQLNTVNYNDEWDTWSIGGQGIILYSNDNANTFKVAYEQSPSETYDLQRVTFFGSWANVANVSRPPAEQRILNNQIFSGTIVDTSYVAGQETTYYLVIGNMNGNTVLAGQIFLQVQEIKR